MNFSRILFSFLTGLLLSLFLALTFFHLRDFPSPIDRLFLVLVPTLAFGIFLHQTFFSPSAQTRNHPSPVANPHSLLSIPHSPFPTLYSPFSILYSLLSFLPTLALTSAATGFLREVLRTPFGMFLFALAFMTMGTTIGYFLIPRAAQSLRNGFLNKPLNLILALSLPAFLIAVTLSALQFPALFVTEYIRVPQEWLPLFLLTALASIFLSLYIITHYASRITHLLHPFDFAQGKPSSFILHHSPGLYASALFLLIQLVIARALNHPALDHNTVLFESDAGPWMTILASPESAPINRAVHPLSLILIRPLVRLISGPLGEHYALGGMIAVSAVSALCVFMTWLIVKRATNSKTYAFTFAILLGSTATHLLFGALTENYIFGAAALIFFFLLVQKNETRFSFLVPAGLLLFGITITNIVQGLIALFFNKFGFKRLAQYALCVFALGVLLTLAVGILYPKSQTLFFLPNDIAFEFNFANPDNAGVLSDPIRFSDPQSVARKLNVVSRSILLYGIIAPDVIESVSEKPPFPTIDLKTFDVRQKTLAPYRGLSNLPLALWLILLGGAFIMFVKNTRASRHTPLMLGLLGAIGFNLLMHLFYGTELFLYASYWVYALVFFAALGLSDFAEKTWMQWGLAAIVLAIMLNNYFFVASIFRALDPFYAAFP
ncbi:MAG: hypothetical protein L6Q45_02750 [Anaerolineales bacterium]|nr:hypothetical protein [Anaerolineales bacterium]